jgi:hypothetical protein
LTETQSAGSEQVIALDPIARKVAERYSLLTHLIVAVSLLQEAIPAIRLNPGDAGFAWIEGLAASGLIIAAIREIKFRKGDHHGAIAWTEIFAGVVLIVEAAIKWREGPRHYPLAIARSFVAMMVIGLGLSHARLKQARGLRIDGKGIRWRRRLLFPHVVDWADLRAVSINDRRVSFEKKNGGGLSLGVGRLKNGQQIRDAISSAAGRNGVNVLDNRMLK